MDRVSAPRSEGAGIQMPKPRHPGHQHIQWFELDLDDEFDDPDVEPDDPLPTERHRTVPGFPA